MFQFGRMGCIKFVLSTQQLLETYDLPCVSMSKHICNYFHQQDINDKCTTFSQQGPSKCLQLCLWCKANFCFLYLDWIPQVLQEQWTLMLVNLCQQKQQQFIVILGNQSYNIITNHISCDQAHGFKFGININANIL